MSPFLPLTPALIDQLAREGYRWHVLHWKGETDFWLTHFRDYKDAHYAYQATHGKYRFLFDLTIPAHRAKLERPLPGFSLWSERIDRIKAIALCDEYDAILRKWFQNHCFHKPRPEEPLRKELVLFNGQLHIIAGEGSWRNRFKLADLDRKDGGGIWAM